MHAGHVSKASCRTKANFKLCSCQHLMHIAGVLKQPCFRCCINVWTTKQIYNHKTCTKTTLMTGILVAQATLVSTQRLHDHKVCTKWTQTEDTSQVHWMHKLCFVSCVYGLLWPLPNCWSSHVMHRHRSSSTWEVNLLVVQTVPVAGVPDYTQSYIQCIMGIHEWHACKWIVSAPGVHELNPKIHNMYIYKNNKYF